MSDALWWEQASRGEIEYLWRRAGEVRDEPPTRLDIAYDEALDRLDARREEQQR
jgi:hypothetical protein